MSLSTLGYFVGWLLGFLAAMLMLSVAKELIVGAIAFAAVAVVVDTASKWFNSRNKEVDTAVQQINMTPVIGVVA